MWSVFVGPILSSNGLYYRLWHGLQYHKSRDSFCNTYFQAEEMPPPSKVRVYSFGNLLKLQHSLRFIAVKCSFSLGDRDLPSRSAISAHFSAHSFVVSI